MVAAVRPRAVLPDLVTEDVAGSEDNSEAELDGFGSDDAALPELLSQSPGTQRRCEFSGNR